MKISLKSWWKHQCQHLLRFCQ